MITANKGNTKIAGTNYDIIYEFNSIIGALHEDNPEIVLGAISAWATILDIKTDNVDKTHLTFVARLSEDIVKGFMESEDNDD